VTNVGPRVVAAEKWFVATPCRYIRSKLGSLSYRDFPHSFTASSYCIKTALSCLH